MECQYSNKKLVGFLAGQILAITLLIFTTLYLAEGIIEQVIGWFGAIFFSLVFLYTLSLWSMPAPHLIINEAGIHDHRVLLEIEWNNILDLQASERYLFVEVANPEPVEAKLPGWRKFLLRMGRGFNRSIGSNTYMINCVGLSAKAKEVYAYIAQNNLRLSKSAV